METASTVWTLTCTALVLFMTLPGLALFYGGLVRQKNFLSVLTQCFGIAAVASVTWMVAGYSFAFGGGGFWFGGFSQVGLGNEDQWLTALFQMTFAIITPALIIGALVERVKFSFIMAFTVLWVLFVYAPVAGWIWGGGALSADGFGLFNGVGLQDLAGGVVVHETAGLAALVLVLLLGARQGFPKAIRPPHQPGLVMIGAAMLWVGWFGFNGGSASPVDGGSTRAILVTHLSASAACITWAAWEYFKGGKVSLVGIVTGMVAGLASITPAAGVVGPVGALIIGGVAGVLCQEAITLIKMRFSVDDSLDVFAVHGIGGLWGTLVLPFLAFPALGGTGLGFVGDTDQAVGVGQQFLIQLAGVSIVGVFTIVGTLIIAFVCRAIFGMRLEDAAIEDGADYASHGESAYDLS